MDNISFSVKGAFSYAWHENDRAVCLPRFLQALCAAVRSCFCGYRVSVEKIKPLLNGSSKRWFEQEYYKKISERNVAFSEDEQYPVIVDQDSDNGSNTGIPLINANSSIAIKQGCKTFPHSGIYHGREGGRYNTEDINENSVKVTFTKSGSPVCIKYDYIKTDSNADAFSKLEEKLNCTFNEFDEMKSNIIASTTNLPDFRIVNGDVKNQIEYLERHSGDSRLVILNASQLNYQEQLDENHDIKDNIAGVYNDRTFGPGVVKTQKGGPEFLAHLLIDGNRIEFYGAFCDFFTAAKRSGTPISAQGGYYKSDMTSEQWNTLKKELCSSETHVQGLRWRKCNGTIVYQTGAINSGGDEYWYLHNKEKPTEAFEFAVIFLQFRNALLEETNKDGFVDIHTTRIGEGVFGNHQFVSMLALRAALLSLPEANRSRIRTVNIGTYTKEEQQNTEAYLGELFKDMVPVGR